LVLAYGEPQALALSDVAPYALLIVALIAATAVALAKWPRLGFLGAWFFVTLAPTSSIVPIATEVGAERRMYLPLAALVALAGVAGARGVRLLGPTTIDPTAARRRRAIANASGLTVATVVVAL